MVLGGKACISSGFGWFLLETHGFPMVLQGFAGNVRFSQLDAWKGVGRLRYLQGKFGFLLWCWRCSGGAGSA